MNIRTNQKNSLKTILETISYNSVTLPVFLGVKTTHDRLPYVFITSSELTPNKNEGTLTDRGTYTRQRGYDINLVFYAESSVSSINTAEVQIDELEQLVLDTISAEATRNNGISWQDVYVTSITAPISGADVNMQANYIVKTISVICETYEAYN